MKKTNKKQKGRRRPKEKESYTVKVNSRYGFLPPRLIDTLKWGTHFATTMLTGTYTQSIYRINSVFQPSTVDTHQPYGFDQVSNDYNHYRVYKIKWRVSIPSVNDSVSYTVSVMNGSQTTTVTTLASYITSMEVPFSVTKVCGLTSGGSVVFNGQMSLHKLTGKTFQQYLSDDIYGSTTSSSPSELLQMVISYGNISVSTVIIRPSIEFWYTVEFYDPFIQGSSFKKKEKELDPDFPPLRYKSKKERIEEILMEKSDEF